MIGGEEFTLCFQSKALQGKFLSCGLIHDSNHSCRASLPNMISLLILLVELGQLNWSHCFRSVKEWIKRQYYLLIYKFQRYNFIFKHHIIQTLYTTFNTNTSKLYGETSILLQIHYQLVLLLNLYLFYLN